jgi:hypothetical protein
MLKNKIITIICLSTFFLSCKKNEQDISFRGEAKIFFAPHMTFDGQTGTTALSDSIDYSFAHTANAEYADIPVSLQVMGNIADRDRIVNVMPDPTGTTALKTDYVLPEKIVIPAQSAKGQFILRVKLSPRLTTERVLLTLRLAQSADFTVDPVKPGKINELVSFRILWSNILLRPDDWPSAWGGYSQVKHRLVIERTGYISYSGMTWTQDGLTYKVMGICNDWLENFNAANPGNPYRDESGQIIRFCMSCQ